MDSKPTSVPDALRERWLSMNSNVFLPYWPDVEALLDEYDRSLQERYAVNVGLIAENAELKRKLRGPRTLSDLDTSEASAEGNDAGSGAA